MQSFYYPDLHSGSISSDHPMYHQITRVLRMAIGQDCDLFNGDGTTSLVTIDSIDSRKIQYHIIDTYITPANPKKQLTLLQALPNKYDKLDYIIQKGIECGIGEFVFFPSRYSHIRSLDDKRIKRLEKIAMEAVEQCGRSDIPQISILSSLPVIGQKTLFFHTNTQLPIISEVVHNFKKYTHIQILVGPEGGWSPNEVATFSNVPEVMSVSLGNRILRLETVTPAVAFMLMNGY